MAKQECTPECSVPPLIASVYALIEPVCVQLVTLRYIGSVQLGSSQLLVTIKWSRNPSPFLSVASPIL